jgi:hypothetical protein
VTEVGNGQRYSHRRSNEYGKLRNDRHGDFAHKVVLSVGPWVFNMTVRRSSGVIMALAACSLVFCTLGGTPAAGARNAVTEVSSAHSRTLTCDENMGAGVGPLPTGTVTVAHVALIGVVKAAPLTLERLGGGILWYKTYFDLRRSKQRHIEVTVRSITSGQIGLDWGNQSVSSTHHAHYSPSSSLKSTALSVPLCGSSSAGYPGGFVMTKPLCAEVTVSAGKLHRSTRLPFGGVACPT